MYYLGSQENKINKNERSLRVFWTDMVSVMLYPYASTRTSHLLECFFHRTGGETDFYYILSSHSFQEDLLTDGIFDSCQFLLNNTFKKQIVAI
jgi:hypothetical protein